MASPYGNARIAGLGSSSSGTILSQPLAAPRPRHQVPHEGHWRRAPPVLPRLVAITAPQWQRHPSGVQ